MPSLSTKNISNRPFSSSLVSLCQNESERETIYMKMSSAFGFISIQIKVIFIRLVLKQRHKGARKWPIFNSLQKFRHCYAGPSSQSPGAACLPFAVCTIYESLKRSNF